MPPPTASFSKNGKRRNRTASGSGIWRDVVCVELNALLLVRLSRVNVDDRDVAVEEFLEHFDMHGRIGADRPVARNLFQQKSLCRGLAPPAASAHHAPEEFSGSTTREAVA